LCVEPGKMCMKEMTAIDAKGGLGMAGIENTLPLNYDKSARRGAVFGPEPAYVVGACSTDTPGAKQASALPLPANATPLMTPLMGAGLTPPYLSKPRQSSTSFFSALRPKSDS
jgi:cytochrome o ubiquinol oxidase subunit 2